MEPEEQGSTLTSIVGQPPVVPALEVGAVELCTLLRPEVPHAVWAALHENVGVNVGTREAAILPYPPSMSWSPGVLRLYLIHRPRRSYQLSPSVPGRFPEQVRMMLGGRTMGSWAGPWGAGPTQALPRCGRYGGCAPGPRSWRLHLSYRARAPGRPQCLHPSLALLALLRGPQMGKAGPKPEAS